MSRLGRSVTAVFLGFVSVVVLSGGMIGFVLSAAGAIATIPMKLGPAWYPILLALSALSTAWFGGVLHRRKPAPV
jgi:hypothetical protein